MCLASRAHSGQRGQSCTNKFFSFREKKSYSFFGCVWHQSQYGQLRLREGIPEKITTAFRHWPIWGESEKVAQIPRKGGGGEFGQCPN